MKPVLVFQNDMNGGVAFSAKGRGMWVVGPSELTAGVRFGSESPDARHPLDWPILSAYQQHGAAEKIDEWHWYS